MLYDKYSLDAFMLKTVQPSSVEKNPVILCMPCLMRTLWTDVASKVLCCWLPNMAMVMIEFYTQSAVIYCTVSGNKLVLVSISDHA